VAACHGQDTISGISKYIKIRKEIINKGNIFPAQFHGRGIMTFKSLTVKELFKASVGTKSSRPEELDEDWLGTDGTPSGPKRPILHCIGKVTQVAES
jgi:hypothetical protein